MQIFPDQASSVLAENINNHRVRVRVRLSLRQRRAGWCPWEPSRMLATFFSFSPITSKLRFSGCPASIPFPWNQVITLASTFSDHYGERRGRLPRRRWVWLGLGEGEREEREAKVEGESDDLSCVWTLIAMMQLYHSYKRNLFKIHQFYCATLTIPFTIVNQSAHHLTQANFSHVKNMNVSFHISSSTFLLRPFILKICPVTNKFQLMNDRLRASANRIQHITHMLNTSTAKNAHSFKGGQRFNIHKSTSPDVFYELPSSLGRRSCSFGIGHRRSLEKMDYTEPARYRVPSQFDVKKESGGKGAFGIGREEYYKGKAQKQQLGPGTYNLKDPIDSKRFYMGRRVESARAKHELSSCSYRAKGEAYAKLSSYRNNDTSLRMRTEYFPKHQLSAHDNKVPGPGSYTQRSGVSSGSYSQQRKKVHSFGDNQRGKQQRRSNLGPGSYNIFSEFGNNL